MNTNTKYVLIKSTDWFYSLDDIDGRIRTKTYRTYEKAYEAMKNDIVDIVKIIDPRGYMDYLDGVLNHVEFSNVYLGENEARIHRDCGDANDYWKIVKVDFE